MGLFSSIQESFNPDIVERFNTLYDRHYQGAKFFYDFAMKSPFVFGIVNSPGSYESFSRSIEYWKKKFLVQYEMQIIDIDKDFTQEKHKQEIIEMAKKYPRAYLFFCKQKGVPASSIYDVKDYLRMPGQVRFSSFPRAKRFLAGKVSKYSLSTADSKPPFYDEYFESLINKELEGFPRDPIYSGIISSYVGLGMGTRTHAFLSSIAMEPSFSKPHGLSVLNGVVSVTFKENKDVTILYPYVSKFETKEKEIEELWNREHLWGTFEKNIIFHPLGSLYYKSFFRTKYGTESVPISAYEELAKDPTPLNDYISKQEADYRHLKKEYPNGIAQFEKTHPQIPHAEYGIYERDIQKLEVQSKYVKYPENQNDLSKILMTKLAGKTSWSFEQLCIQCNAESYDRQSHFSSCSMVFASHQLMLDKALEDSLEPNTASKYPHCKELLDAGGLNSMTSSSLIGILSEVLIPMIDSYLSIFKPVCVVLDEMVEYVLESGSIKKASSTLLDALLKIKSYQSSDVQITTESVFRRSHPDYIPYIFVQMQNSSELAKKKLSELADTYLLSSIISVIKVINEDQIIEIESSRRKDEENNKIRRIQEIKRDYPYGFDRFCMHNRLSENVLVNRYDLIINSIGEIRQLQISEEERNREEARRQREETTINQARSLISSYPNVAREEGYSSSSLLDYAAAQTILSRESSWREIEQLFYGRFSLLGTTKSVSALPHKYFFDYYPSNKYRDSELTNEQNSNRSFVWGFKDGKDYCQSKAIEMVSDYINSSGLKRYAKKLVFVCSPASNGMSNSTRFRNFSEEVCRRTGMINGFEHIHLTGIAVPKHKGGSGCVPFEVDRSFFSGRFVILFDDLVTSGGTISLTKKKLEAVGARPMCIISLGQTTSNR